MWWFCEFVLLLFFGGLVLVFEAEEGECLFLNCVLFMGGGSFCLLIYYYYYYYYYYLLLLLFIIILIYYYYFFNFSFLNNDIKFYRYILQI